jgi:dTDP-4-amino-4,6-dideoxygalactose transaminase
MEDEMNRIPLVKPHLPQIEDIQNELREMLTSGRLTNFGPFSELLEKEFSELIGVKHALCVSNATTGLILLLSTLPKGSDVLVPSFTFLPTVQAILWNSLRPVFVDIDEGTYTISPGAVASSITKRTSAILAVNVFGNPCDIDELDSLAKDVGVSLFFDSAHAFGARHKGKHLGQFGNAEVFSLSATKTLPCGEGGMITTNSDVICNAIIDRRNYGFKANSRDCSNLGLNGKLAEFSAILGLKEINGIDTQIEARNRIASDYCSALNGLAGIGFQQVSRVDVCAYKDFTITMDSRSAGVDRNILKKELEIRGIETESYFSPAIHQMSYFNGKRFEKGRLANTEAIEKKILSLPIYSDLKNEDLRYIIKSVKEVCEIYGRDHSPDRVNSCTKHAKWHNYRIQPTRYTHG